MQISRLGILTSRDKDGGSEPAVLIAPPKADGKLDPLLPVAKHDVVQTTKRSAYHEKNGRDDERGCIEAVAALVAAIMRAYKQASGRAVRAEAEESSPALLQTSKGSGTIECLDSARELLRFFGHAPLLHLEGVIWVKASAERVHCLGALSSWSLFLIPLRDPSFMGGVLHGLKKVQNISDRIVEIPLRSIVDVAVISGREHINTFRSVEANSVSRPFRIVTTTDPSSCDGTEPAMTDDLERSTTEEGKHHRVVLVGFEEVCRLRHLLVLACESWAIRTAWTSKGVAVELLSCARVAVQRYLKGVFEAMTGSLRYQVEAQVELMDDLANELILDAVVKDVFFSTGDIFFEIAHRLEAAAVAATATATATSDLTGEEAAVAQGCDRTLFGGNQGESRLEVEANARFISAAAGVLDAAFFHSMQFPDRVHLVGRPKPMCLPVVSENLVRIYCALHRRIVRLEVGADVDRGGERRKGLSGVSCARDGLFAERGGIPKGAMVPLAEVSKGILDCVVRAINGMSDVIRLFNIENENLGLVRNLVGVGIGTRLRAGVQPDGTDALAFLVSVNDRTVGLIQDLDREEQERRQKLKAERLLAQELAASAAAAGLPSTTGDKKESSRSVFARVASSLSPVSRLRRSVTMTPPPSPPPASPASLLPATGHSAVGGNYNNIDIGSGGSGLHGVLESGRRAGESGTSRQHGGSVEDRIGGLLGSRPPSWRRRRGTAGPSPPPMAPAISQPSSSRDFLFCAPALLHSYAKLLNALVCGSYNLRAAYSSSCEADLRNIGRTGGYLDMLAGLDGGVPRMVFRQTALFLLEILIECHH